MTPLHQAAYKGNRELCAFLLNSGADVNSNSHEHGYTALMFAALSGIWFTVVILCNPLTQFLWENMNNDVRFWVAMWCSIPKNLHVRYMLPVECNQLFHCCRKVRCDKINAGSWSKGVPRELCRQNCRANGRIRWYIFRYVVLPCRIRVQSWLVISTHRQTYPAR